MVRPVGVEGTTFDDNRCWSKARINLLHGYCTSYYTKGERMITEPKGPYVYQPYGMQDKPQWESGRIYGIGGHAATIKGLTKEEADAVCKVLSEMEVS